MSFKCILSKKKLFHQNKFITACYHLNFVNWTSVQVGLFAFKKKKATIVIPIQFDKIQTSKLLTLIHASNLDSFFSHLKVSEIAVIYSNYLTEVSELCCKSYYL